MKGSGNRVLRLLEFTARAPSGHNTQPWVLVRTAPHRLVLRSDPRRWLPAVDPANRELLLSTGALIEALRQAAPAVGYRADIRPLADRADARDIARVEFVDVPTVSSTVPDLIRARATTRTPFLLIDLSSEETHQLLSVEPNALRFVPRHTIEGGWLGDALLAALAQQTWDDRRQAE